MYVILNVPITTPGFVTRHVVCPFTRTCSGATSDCDEVGVTVTIGLTVTPGFGVFVGVVVTIGLTVTPGFGVFVGVVVTIGLTVTPGFGVFVGVRDGMVMVSSAIGVFVGVGVVDGVSVTLGVAVGLLAAEQVGLSYQTTDPILSSRGFHHQTCCLKDQSHLIADTSSIPNHHGYQTLAMNNQDKYI